MQLSFLGAFAQQLSANRGDGVLRGMGGARYQERERERERGGGRGRGGLRLGRKREKGHQNCCFVCLDTFSNPDQLLSRLDKHLFL